MPKPLGGRGKKAPYETVQVRTPLPIKHKVEKLIADYRNTILNADVESQNDEIDSECECCLKLIDRFIEETGQSDKLHTRNNVNLIRFRNWLFSQTNRNIV